MDFEDQTSTDHAGPRLAKLDSHSELELKAVGDDAAAAVADAGDDTVLEGPEEVAVEHANLDTN